VSFGWRLTFGAETDQTVTVLRHLGQVVATSLPTRRVHGWRSVLRVDIAVTVLRHLGQVVATRKRSEAERFRGDFCQTVVRDWAV